MIEREKRQSRSLVWTSGGNITVESSHIFARTSAKNILVNEPSCPSASLLIPFPFVLVYCTKTRLYLSLPPNH